MTNSSTITEADILNDIIQQDQGTLSPEAAQSLLRWKFSEDAQARMTELASRNQEGIITEQERDELEKYLRVGSFINLVQAKARLSLVSSNTSS